MANSSLVIGLGVSNTGGGMLLRSWLVNEGVMVRFARCCWLLGACFKDDGGLVVYEVGDESKPGDKEFLGMDKGGL